jgi:hypothetical protein
MNEEPFFSFIAKRASHDILVEPTIYHRQLTQVYRHDIGLHQSKVLLYHNMQ